MIYLCWCAHRRWEAGGAEKRADSRRLTSLLSLCPLCTQVSHWVSFLCLPAASRNYPTPPPSAAQVTQPWYHSAGYGWLTLSIIQTQTGFTSWCWAAVCPILQGSVWTEHAEMKHCLCSFIKKQQKNIKSLPTPALLCCYCASCLILLHERSWQLKVTLSRHEKNKRGN